MPKSYPLRVFLSRSKRHKRETKENNPRTLYAGASPRMIRQNTQFSSPPSSSPPSAAPPPAHVEVETDHAAASAGCRSRSSPGGAGSSGRRWDRSTASRRGIEDIIWAWVGTELLAGEGGEDQVLSILRCTQMRPSISGMDVSHWLLQWINVAWFPVYTM
jgi:hypothetical protein